MGLEKLAKGEVSAVLRENVSVTTEGEAIARFKEVTKILDFYRPADEIAKRKAPLACDEAVESLEQHMIAIVACGGGVVSLTSLVVGLLNPVVSVSIGLLTFLATGVFIGLRTNDGRSKNKVRNWLSKTFLTKKFNTKVREHGILLDEYDQSVKLYKLLVEKARMQLESEGVFELVNHPNQTNFIALNSMGYVEELTAKQWRKRVGELATSKSFQTELSTAKELQEKIYREILSSP